MTTVTQDKTDREDKPLTRADVERLIRQVGSSEKLNLRGRNLRGIDLSHFDLTKANLVEADLSRANLNEAILFGTLLVEANLSRASLKGADLRTANLSGANLIGAILSGANLFEADLSGAFLSGAILLGAILHKANLSGTILSGANLFEADLEAADLEAANLFGANLFGANLRRIHISEREKEQLRNRGAKGLDEPNMGATAGSLTIRVVEEPLTAHNLTTILSALTELSTKYWLIAKERFAELIEYTQTRNDRFAEEAQVVVTRITYNSPMNMDWKVDLSAPSVAEALVTTIDGIIHVRKRLERAELENQALASEVKRAEQQVGQERQIAIFEREKQQLEIERRHLEVLEKRLEVQKKGIEYALEIAGKVVDILHPHADSATRAMEIQALLPNLVQLQGGKGLELALPAPQKSGEEGETPEIR